MPPPILPLVVGLTAQPTPELVAGLIAGLTARFTAELMAELIAGLMPGLVGRLIPPLREELVVPPEVLPELPWAAAQGHDRNPLRDFGS